jgi:hypothetical protein
MSGLDELRISFFQECEDLLESLGEGLRAMSELAASGPPPATSKRCMRCSAPYTPSRVAQAPSVSMTW